MGSGAGSTVAAADGIGSVAREGPASWYASGENARWEMLPSAFVTLQKYRFLAVNIMSPGRASGRHNLISCSVMAQFLK